MNEISMNEDIFDLALSEVKSIPVISVEEFSKKLEQELDIDWMEAKSGVVEVKDEDSARLALAMAMQSRKIDRTLEKSRLEITRPHLDYQRAINKIVKDVRTKIEQIEQSLQNKIEGWMRSQNCNPFTKVDELRVEDGSIYIQKEWQFAIDDKYEIPTEYLMPDEALIRDAVRKGVRSIPGVKIFEVEKTSMRIKNHE